MCRTLLLGVLVGMLVSAARADDWPQWLGPKRDGVWRETGILDKFPANGPPVKWRTPIGSGYAGPAVAGGKVFVNDRVLADGSLNPASGFTRNVVGGKDGVAVAFGKDTGKDLWRALTAKEPGYCPPMIFDLNGKRELVIWRPDAVNGLDPETGKVIWSHPWRLQSGLSVPTPRQDG